MTTNMITGIGGFVASHMADLLIEKGEVVLGTCRWTEDLTRVNHIKDKIVFIPMDLNDLSSCLIAIETYKPDYIFHLVAQSYVSDSFLYPAETIRTNTLGTLNLLEAIRIVKNHYEEYDDAEFYDPIIHICSSSEVYGLVEEKDIPIKETQAFNPANPYAVGKVGEDMLALMYFTNYKIKTIRTRMFTHTGPRRTMMSAECNFAKQIAQLEKGHYTQDKLIIKHGNLDSIRTWADVRDAVKAYYILVRKGIPGEVYNIGGNTTKTIGEVLNYLVNLSPLGPVFLKQQDSSLLRPYDVTLQIPDCSKFKKDTGWEPEIPFEKTMLDLLNWWREQV